MWIVKYILSIDRLCKELCEKGEGNKLNMACVYIHNTKMYIIIVDFIRFYR